MQPQLATQPETVDLSPEEKAILGEYDRALIEVRLRRLQLKEENERLDKAVEEITNNVHGTVRLIVRQHKLEGNWRPSADSSQLIRSN